MRNVSDVQLCDLSSHKLETDGTVQNIHKVYSRRLQTLTNTHNVRNSTRKIVSEFKKTCAVSCERRFSNIQNFKIKHSSHFEAMSLKQIHSKNCLCSMKMIWAKDWKYLPPPKYDCPNRTNFTAIDTTVETHKLAFGAEWTLGYIASGSRNPNHLQCQNHQIR